MIRLLLIPALCVALAGCAVPERRAPETSEPVSPEPVVAEPERRLPGTTIASLGDATRPGRWMCTPLVSGPMRGRVSDPATGRSVTLDLLPLDADPGAGSRMSLAAYRALGLPLTALPDLRVSRAG